MRVKDILRAQKVVTDKGKWRQEKMPASQFPLRGGKRSAFVLRAAWRWRVVQFTALGNDFRALIAYRPDIEEYRAYLGIVVDGDTRLVLDYAYHGSHDPPGWHVHSTCGPIEELPIGVMRSPRYRRFPKGSRAHRRNLLVASGSQMTDSLAYHIFAKRARLPEEPLDLFSHGAKP